MSATIVWFRQDLRLTDHAALKAAVDRGVPIIPVYLLSNEEEGEWNAGGATRWWLHQSLQSLSSSLENLGSRLILREGPALAELELLLEQTGADVVYWSRRYEPEIIARDQQIKQELRSAGYQANSFNGSLLKEPWEVETKSGAPYQVFSPYWKRIVEADEFNEPLPAPQSIPTPEQFPESDLLEDWGLEPTIPWAEQMRSFWNVGEQAALDQLQRFLKQGLAEYNEERNRPDHVGTSFLSPYLHFGEISPRTILYEVNQWQGRKPQVKNQSDADVFLSEVGWREFAYHLLYHFPQTTHKPLREKFDDFEWEDSTKQLKLWQQGQTGFPIVDAGMRQLWAIGWMHNRVRMIVASFLTKDLFIHWKQGADWFWKTLVDADLANNTLGWQWTAGCGADAAPYFRIFNPVSQGERYDPEGSYIREWIPELSNLETKYIHKPWEAPESALKQAGIQLGKDYPLPIVDHSEQRKIALERFAKIK